MTLFMDDVYRLHIKQLKEIALIWTNIFGVMMGCYLQTSTQGTPATAEWRGM